MSNFLGTAVINPILAISWKWMNIRLSHCGFPIFFVQTHPTSPPSLSSGVRSICKRDQRCQSLVSNEVFIGFPKGPLGVVALRKFFNPAAPFLDQISTHINPQKPSLPGVHLCLPQPSMDVLSVSPIRDISAVDMSTNIVSARVVGPLLCLDIPPRMWNNNNSQKLWKWRFKDLQDPLSWEVSKVSWCFLFFPLKPMRWKKSGWKSFVFAPTKVIFHFHDSLGGISASLCHVFLNRYDKTW